LSLSEERKALAKVYSPAEVEEKWYTHWEVNHLFHATVHAERRPYTIVIPPPNITGVLHMGHILNNTLQDVFVRYRRMMGYEACWIPGTDHAGIATQNVVERALIKEGKTRHDLGREEFVRRVWKWKEKYGGVIITQLRKLGSSCDWDREKFTMDETLSAAVREVFVQLYHEGLIYRGKYIVNWCPKDHTAISDDEVEYTEQQGKLYYIRYLLKKGKPREKTEYVTVATTRPETLLGDVAVAVNPGDDRFHHLIGRTAILPLVGREIPVIADDFVDPTFGTGMVKVTPAHDPNDYEIGQRHSLPQINIFDVSATLNENAPEQYRAMDRYEARTMIIRDLEEQQLLVKTEEHTNSVGRCYRCNTVIEPYLSDQWFVKMRPLAEPALKVVTDGLIRFYPDRWTKVYQHWMTNIRDWCISRQLWWGHRIPVWYCANAESATPVCSGPIVSRSTPEKCPHCGGSTLRQDEDVLDTWFSSWLWPFSVHDWPAQAEHGKGADLRYFYPTDTLVTAPEIIFFWVARMIMAGLKFAPGFTGSTDPSRNIPFRDVYFTSTVRDEKGRRMSKSLGNSPDPLDLIAEYGADAVRFTTLFIAPLGQDVIYGVEKNEIGRNFANKIWNAGRFLLLNREQIGEAERDPDTPPQQVNLDHLDLVDRWLLSRFHSTTVDISEALERFEVNKLAKTIYEFFWHDYCDWYLELIKSRLYGEEPLAVRKAVVSRAIAIFDGALRLLHPLMPFVTEELWQHLRDRKPLDTVMHAPLFPADHEFIDRQAEEEMAFVQKMIETLRAIRGEMSIPPSTEISVVIRLSQNRSIDSIRKYEGYLSRLARVTAVTFIESDVRPHHSASAVVDGEEFFVPLEGVIDLEVEKARLQKEIERVSGMLENIRNKLNNSNFLGKAPEDVVRKEREKLQHFGETLEKLEKNFQTLN
jgi:valyl-tRNA synthetase